MNYSPETDGALIDSIYAALFGETSWGHFLDKLSDRAPDGRTILFSHNMQQSDEYLAMLSRCEGPEIEAYAAHYVNTNPWLVHCAIRKVGLGVFSDEIVPIDQLIRTEFFNDWLVPNNVACSIGVTLDKNGPCPLIVSTITSRADPELNRQFSEQLTRIGPHLTRAARFYRNGFGSWNGIDKGLTLFDAMHISAVIVGEDGRIKAASKPAQAMLTAGDLIATDVKGKARIADPAAQDALRRMLRRTYDGPRSLVFRAASLKITIVQIEKDSISLLFEGPTVVIMLEKVVEMVSGLDQVCSAYKLSPAERRILSGIVDGKTITEMAEDAGLSRETIKTHLKHIYAKTGTSRQAQLIRLVIGKGH